MKIEFGLITPTSEKKTMSVPEMRRILGMKKVEAYWLIQQNFFKTITVNGHYRIFIDSFEKWYGSQWRYRKVNGEPPGRGRPDLICKNEIEEMLGITLGSADYIIYTIAKFKIYKQNNITCVSREEFEKWYQSQNYYKKKETDDGCRGDDSGIGPDQENDEDT